MPIWVASLLGGLLALMSSLVGRVLVVLGIGTVTYTGINTAFDVLRDRFRDALANADLVGIASTLQLDTCLSILIAAASFKYVINGALAGSLSKWVKTTPTNPLLK